METLNNAQTAPQQDRFAAMIEKLYKQPAGILADGQGIEATIQNQFAAMSAVNHTWKRETFYRLLMVMYNKRCFSVLKNPANIDVLANISSFGNKAVRPVEEWVKDSLLDDGLLAGMIRHMFAKYNVPEFMEYVFAQKNIIHMHWYIQLGRGDSVQQLCGFPVVFTNKMAHAFRNTPGSVYTIEQAIRRAQAIGLGADTAMAEGIAWSAALDDIKTAEMRTAAIRLAAKGKANIGFVAMQKVFGYIAEISANNSEYSLKGRTWVSVLKAADEYLAERAKKIAAREKADWTPAEISNYEAVEDKTTYRIIQLLTAEDLYEEGHEMSHCVGDYDHDCAEGSTAIFSLRKFAEGSSGYDTLATLEITLPEKDLVQAKARFNEYISAEAEKHVVAWATAEGLSISCELHEVMEYAAPVQQPAVAHAQVQAAAPLIRPVEAPYQYALQENGRPAPVINNRNNNTGSDISSGDVLKIVLFIIKAIIIIARIAKG